MARRSKAELLDEFHRLSDAFDWLWAVELGRYPEAADMPPASREQQLAAVEDGAATLSDIIAGTREAVSDMIRGFNFDAPDPPEAHLRFFAEYRQATGRDFFADAGRPNQRAKAILKRGQIKDDEEFRLLLDLLNDLDQKVLTSRQTDTANALLAAYEAAP